MRESSGADPAPPWGVHQSEGVDPNEMDAGEMLDILIRPNTSLERAATEVRLLRLLAGMEITLRGMQEALGNAMERIQQLENDNAHIRMRQSVNKQPD